ncbi:hypothetical protein X759_30125 [Mesorhizobium sp. LSHC420B00]|nr:hypothetical protein X759_30125 [Mesorhizobium sp. LSHC420B00]
MASSNTFLKSACAGNFVVKFMVATPARAQDSRQIAHLGDQSCHSARRLLYSNRDRNQVRPVTQ